MAWEDLPTKTTNVAGGWEDLPVPSNTESSAAGAFAKHAVMEAPEAVGGMAGAGAAMALGAPLAAASGPLAPVTELVLGITGAFGGAAIFGKIKEELKTIPGADKLLESVGLDDKSLATAEKEHPYSSFAGGLAPNLAFFRPGSVSKMERGMAMVIGGGIEAGQELSSEGKVDPLKVGMATTFMGATPKPTALGAKFLPGAKGGAKETPPPKPPVDPVEEAKQKTDKEQEFIERIKKETEEEKAKAEQKAKEEAEAKPAEEVKARSGEESATKTLDLRTGTRKAFFNGIEREEAKAQQLEERAEQAARDGNEELAKSLNKQLDAHRSLIEQARKEAPKADRESHSTSWEYGQDIVAGSRNVGEALQAVLDHGTESPVHNALAKLLLKSERVRNAPLYISEEKFFNPKPNRFGTYDQWRGGYTHFKGSDVEFVGHVNLYEGGGIQTLMHEAVHAATYGALLRGTESGKALHNLFSKLQEEFTAKEKLAYGSTDAYEMVAEALSNKSFMKIMQGKKGSTNNTTLWQDFKDIVAKIIGANKDHERTALDDVIEHVSRIVEGKDKKDLMPWDKGYVPPERVDLDFTRGVVGSAHPELAGAPIPDEARLDPSKIKDEKDFEAKAKELMATKGEQAVRDFHRQWEAQKAGVRDHVKEAEEFIHENLKNKEALLRIVDNNTKDLTEMADKPTREAVSVAIDEGKTSGLTGAAKAIAEKYQKLMADIGGRAFDEGVIKGLIENYVTHIVDWTKDKPGAAEEFLARLFGEHAATEGKMTPESRFGKDRKYKTFEDLQKALKDSGKEIRTKDIAEIYKTYAQSMEKAIENKKLIDQLKIVRNLNGDQMVRKVTDEEPIKHNEEVIPSGQFAGYVANKELMPAIKWAFEAKNMGDFMKAAHTISQFIKRSNVVASLFHAKTLLEVLSSSRVPLVTPMKEISLAFADKYLGTKMSGLTKAVEAYRRGGMGDSVDQWLRSGLIARPPEDVQIGVMASMGKLSDALISKFAPETHIMEKGLTFVEKKTLGLTDRITWDFLHTGGKIMVAEHYLQKAKIDAAKSGKEFNEKQSREEISKFVNSSFGGLDWFQLAKDSHTEMGKRIAMAHLSPEGRRGLQVLLFAPDWTVSTLKAFTSALPKELNPAKWHPMDAIQGMRTPKTQADYARLYQFKTVMTYLTIYNGINMMMSGRPIWDNKDPTRIELKDETSVQGLKHALEPYHWVTSPVKTLGAKLGFIPRAMSVAITGTEYSSPDAQKLVDTSAKGRAEQILKMLLPFQAQAALGAPKGEGVQRAVMGTLGIPKLGSNADQKREARAAREKEKKRQAKEYHEEAKRKGWE